MVCQTNEQLKDETPFTVRKHCNARSTSESTPGIPRLQKNSAPILKTPPFLISSPKRAAVLLSEVSDRPQLTIELKMGLDVSSNDAVAARPRRFARLAVTCLLEKNPIVTEHQRSRAHQAIAFRVTNPTHHFLGRGLADFCLDFGHGRKSTSFARTLTHPSRSCKHRNMLVPSFPPLDMTA